MGRQIKTNKTIKITDGKKTFSLFSLVMTSHASYCFGCQKITDKLSDNHTKEHLLVGSMLF